MRRLVNWCVAIFIVLLAACLLWPLIVRVRESSRRTSCANNLRQIGIALSDYHSAFDHFPRAGFSTSSLPPEKRFSWLVDIYPYTHSVGLRLDKTKAWDDPVNLVPKAVGMGGPEFEIGDWPTFHCPSNGNRAGPNVPGLTHYVGISGLGADAPWLPNNDRRAGTFGYDRKVSLGAIKDGPALTMMVAETALENGPWTAAGRPTLRSLIPDHSPYLGLDGQFTSLHRKGANVFASHYPRLTNVLLADGSVRSLDTRLDPAVLEALATIAGGEAVNSPDE